MTDSYDFSTLAETTSASSTLSSLFIGMMIFSSVLSIIMIISYWKIFKKKGKPGWAILIPIYNVIVQIQVANLSMVYFLLLLIPLVNIYAIIKINISMAKTFEKSTAFGIGMVLLPVIFVPLLAFSEDKNETKTETTNNFNAMDVINNNETNNIQNEGIEPIKTVEINSTINNNIPTINSDNNDNSNISNNVVDNTLQNNNEVNNNQINSLDNVSNTVEQDNLVENNTNNTIGQTEFNPLENIPTLENTNTINSEVNNNIDLQNNNLQDNVSNVTSMMNTNVDEPIVNDNTINNNDIPVLNNENNNVETLEINNNTTNNINAFNVKPELNTNSVENNVVDNTVQNEISNKKICKSCGSEMPDIVSICPVCGTDNE